MRRRTPGLVLALAIFHFIFAALGLLTVLCGGFFLLWMASVPANAADPLSRVMALSWQAMRQVPGYIPFAVISLFVHVVMAIVLIFAGIGLLRLRHWARVLSFVYAFVIIVVQVVSAVYTVVYINPAINRMLAQARIGPAGPGFGGPTSDTVTSVAGGLLFIAHAVFTIVVLLVPSVVAALRRTDEDYGYEEDYAGDDRDYDRRGPRHYDDWEHE